MKIIAAALLAIIAESSWAAGAACENLKQLKLPHTEITEAKSVAPGAQSMLKSVDERETSNGLFSTLPAFCRVSAISRPSSDSEIKIEVWLPVQAWNGRMQAVGNGGFSGSIAFNNMAQALKAGYAATGTNTGHDNPATSGEFAYGHPEKLVDWGHRAVHEMALTAKAVIAEYYGSSAKYAYFNGCSTGGRQALVAAERYPEDFDGIVAGDPANPMTRQQTSSLWNLLAVNHDENSWISSAQWNNIHKAAIQACDINDGLKDGLISDPSRCHFDPKTIQCKKGSADDCLTESQIVAYNKLIAGPKNPRTGEQLYPGFPHGPSQEGPNTGRAPIGSALDTFRALFQKPEWDYHTLDFDKDIAEADKVADPIMNAKDPVRLKALFARGGKLLMYHGWNDRAITPLSSVDYYTRAVAANGGKDKTDSLVRLFMVPGMGHCTGGEGPFMFDKVDPLAAWVETGKAPDQIIASHVNEQGKVDRTRPLCPYPKMAMYKGSGSIDEAGSFICAAP